MKVLTGTRIIARTAGLAVWLVFSLSANAQSKVEVSGLIFADYNYVIDSPGDVDNGDNSFDYRRAYLTADFEISERFSGRIRYESRTSTTTEGKPAPFVKDMYLTWNDVFGNGHDMTVGVSPTPNFRLSESVWGYRSLEKTIQDRTGIVSSRDMGITLTGPLYKEGALKYRFMVANNSGVSRETDKYKRLYSAVEYRPDSPLRTAVGADYFQFDGGSATNLFGFIGATEQAWSAGLEAYYNVRSVDEDDDLSRYGLSVFGAVHTREADKLIARFDLFGRETADVTADGNYITIGYGRSFDEHVEIIPNIEYDVQPGTDDPGIRARITVVAKL